MKDLSCQLVSFTIDEQLLAIPLQVVDRIVRAVKITPLGKGPETILGIIDYMGEIIPVLSLRKRLGFKDRPISASDRFMIIQSSTRKLVLVADEIQQVIPASSNRVKTSGVFSEEIEAEGITRSDDGIVLIYDPEKFLSSAEALNLELALKKNRKK